MQFTELKTSPDQSFLRVVDALGDKQLTLFLMRAFELDCWVAGGFACAYAKGVRGHSMANAKDWLSSYLNKPKSDIDLFTVKNFHEVINALSELNFRPYDQKTLDKTAFFYDLSPKNDFEKEINVRSFWTSEGHKIQVIQSLDKTIEETVGNFDIVNAMVMINGDTEIGRASCRERV